MILALAMIAGVVVGSRLGREPEIRRQRGARARLPAVPADRRRQPRPRPPQSHAGCSGACSRSRSSRRYWAWSRWRGTAAPRIEGVATLTYYEPTANWLIMIAMLTVFAAVLARARAASVDAARQPAADRLPGALLPALVLDRRGAGTAAGAAARHVAGGPAPARADRPGRGGGDLAARVGQLPELSRRS